MLILLIVIALIILAAILVMNVFAYKKSYLVHIDHNPKYLNPGVSTTDERLDHIEATLNNLIFLLKHTK